MAGLFEALVADLCRTDFGSLAWRSSARAIDPRCRRIVPPVRLRATLAAKPLSRPRAKSCPGHPQSAGCAFSSRPASCRIGPGNRAASRGVRRATESIKKFFASGKATASDLRTAVGTSRRILILLPNASTRMASRAARRFSLFAKG